MSENLFQKITSLLLHFTTIFRPPYVPKYLLHGINLESFPTSEYQNYRRGPHIMGYIHFILIIVKTIIYLTKRVSAKLEKRARINSVNHILYFLDKLGCKINRTLTHNNGQQKNATVEEHRRPKTIVTTSPYRLYRNNPCLYQARRR